MPNVTIRHARIAGVCSRGMRAFAKEHNLDWDEFLKNGLPSEQFRAIDDATCQLVAEIAEKEVEGNPDE